MKYEADGIERGLDFNEKVAWLSRYRAALREERRLLGEVERVRSRAERVTAGLSGMPSGGGDKSNAPFVPAVERLDALAGQLMDEVAESVALRAEIADAIGAVGDARLRSVLCLRYVDGYTYERIAVETNYSYRQVLRMHAHAVKIVNVSLNVTL